MRTAVANSGSTTPQLLLCTQAAANCSLTAEECEVHKTQQSALYVGGVHLSILLGATRGDWSGVGARPPVSVAEWLSPSGSATTAGLGGGTLKGDLPHSSQPPQPHTPQSDLSVSMGIGGLVCSAVC